MGDMTKLADVVALAQKAQETVSVYDHETVWDVETCDWVPRGELAKRGLARQRRETERKFAESGCAVTDGVFAALRADTLSETPATIALANWWEQRRKLEKPWLVLSGPAGVGKTVAVAHMLWTLGGRFVRADELVRLFASMFGEQYEKQQELRDAHSLVIDDVGGELDHTRMLPALLDLLDSRKSAYNRPTIVTTNLGKKDFAARYSNERLMSRMAESVHWVSLSGEDLRRSK